MQVAQARNPVEASYMISRYLGFIVSSEFEDDVMLEGWETHHVENCDTKECECWDVYSNFGRMDQIFKLQLDEYQMELAQKRAALIRN